VNETKMTPRQPHKDFLSVGSMTTTYSEIDNVENACEKGIKVVHSASDTPNPTPTTEEEMSDTKNDAPHSGSLEKEGSAAKKAVPVRYFIECWDDLKKETFLVDNGDKPFNIQLRTRKPPTSAPTGETEAFRIILEVDGYDIRFGKRDTLGIVRRGTTLRGRKDDSSEDGTNDIPEGVMREEPSIDDVEITDVLQTKIEIHSQPLLEVLREVVDYYPRLVLQFTFIRRE
jgi:hypothetical protein